MSDRDVRPTALMRQLDEDEAVVSSISKTARRVKIEEKHTWNIRLLPVQMGPDKMPYVRLAQHWWNKAPITCPTFTPKGFGGNPDAACPICELSERLNESPSKEIKDLGYSARCVLRFRFWCVVFDIEDARERIDELPMNEVLNPYEFDMYKTTWEDFKKYQKWATTRHKNPSEWGLLDLETGCNLLATHGSKGVRLERLDPSPIFDLNDKNFDNYIAKIWERLRKPSIVIPSEKQLLETAIKIEEYAENGGRKGRDDDRGSSRRSRGGGFRDRDEDRDRDRDGGDEDRGSSRSRYSGEDQDLDEPRSRRSAREEAAPQEEAPARSRRAAAPPAEEEAAPQEQAESVVPPRRTAASAPPPTRRSAPAAQEESPAGETQQESAPQEEQAPPPPRRPAASAPAPARRQPEAQDRIADQDLDKDSTPDVAPAPPTRKVAAAGPAPARRAAPAAQEEPPAEESAEPQRPPARRAAAAQAEPPIGEDEETVAEERKDHAPTVREKVEDAPPAVNAAAPTPKRGNASDLQSRLARLTEKGK